MRHYINHIINFIEACLWDWMSPKGVSLAVEREFYDIGVSMICKRPDTHFAEVTFRKEGKKPLRFHVWDGDMSLMITAMTHKGITLVDSNGFSYDFTWEKFAKGLHFCAA